MSIASWLAPLLLRERDLPRALASADLRAAAPGRDARLSWLEQARALEYVHPDRRIAILRYEHADETGRARELAIELGLWETAGRLACRVGDRAREAEAWWDAGRSLLCELALATLREDTPAARELAALVAGRDLEAQARARAAGDPAAFVMAARFALARARRDDARAHFEAALAANPNDAVAARHLLDLAIASGEPDRIRDYLKLRLVGKDRVAWLDCVRACAFALVATDQHRGFGLRLLRHALERAYQLGESDIPGHLATWTLLARHAAVSGTRLELLPLAIAAIESSREPLDRVWIAALAAEISLRDGGSPQVAGAYAEIVADHAPDHPIVRELVARASGTIDIDVDVPEVPGDALAEDIAEVIATANAGAHTPPPIPPVRALETLRTPDRAAIPPRPPDPPGAIERARRIAIPIDVRLVLADGRSVPGISRDVSTTGLYVLTDADVAPGSELTLELLLPSNEPFMEDEHRCRVRVVRRGDDGYGLELLAPDAALQAALAEL